MSYKDDRGVVQGYPRKYFDQQPHQVDLMFPNSCQLNQKDFKKKKEKSNLVILHTSMYFGFVTTIPSTGPNQNLNILSLGKQYSLHMRYTTSKASKINKI